MRIDLLLVAHFAPASSGRRHQQIERLPVHADRSRKVGGDEAVGSQGQAARQFISLDRLVRIAHVAGAL